MQKHKRTSVPEEAIKTDTHGTDPIVRSENHTREFIKTKTKILVKYTVI